MRILGCQVSPPSRPTLGSSTNLCCHRTSWPTKDAEGHRDPESWVMWPVVWKMSLGTEPSHHPSFGVSRPHFVVTAGIRWTVFKAEFRKEGENGAGG